MLLYPVQTCVHFPDLSRFPFVWSLEHVLCACAVLGDGQPSFPWSKAHLLYTFLGNKRKNTLVIFVFKPPDACTRFLCMHKIFSIEFNKFNRFKMLNYIDLVMNFMKNMFRAKSGPNRSSRPLNTQLLLEISIRIQWKTSRAPTQNQKHKKNSPIWGPLLGLHLE